MRVFASEYSRWHSWTACPVAPSDRNRLVVAKLHPPLIPGHTRELKKNDQSVQYGTDANTCPRIYFTCLESIDSRGLGSQGKGLAPGIYSYQSSILICTSSLRTVTERK